MTGDITCSHVLGADQAKGASADVSERETCVRLSRTGWPVEDESVDTRSKRIGGILPTPWEHTVWCAVIVEYP
jgi:hypothetical protein